MGILPQLVLNSVIAGATYALVAISFNFIYSTTKFFNLAHGVIATIGGYTVFYFSKILGLGTCFDEPFAGLFPEMRKIISIIIQELKQKNKTVILIEHDMSIIRELCDYIFVINEGRLLAEGKPESVLKRKDIIETYFGN
jgi:hypothetical protein